MNDITLTKLINSLGIFINKEMFITKLSASMKTLKFLGFGIFSTTTNNFVYYKEKGTSETASIIHDMYYGHGLGHLIIKRTM